MWYLLMSKIFERHIPWFENFTIKLTINFLNSFNKLDKELFYYMKKLRKNLLHEKFFVIHWTLNPKRTRPS